MTTSILEALIQLFALFAAGRGKEGIAMGRSHAAQYMRSQLPKKLLEESLERYDELVDQFQRMPGQGQEMKAKRLAKLSVKLLRTCSQINKGLEQHEKHVVVVRLLEFLREIPDPATGHLFLQTVVDSFNMDAQAFEAVKAMVSAHDASSAKHVNGLFATDDAWMGKRLGGAMLGYHLEEGNLFLLRSFSNSGIRVNHQDLMPGTVALLAPGGAMRDQMGGVLFHSELVARRNQMGADRSPLNFQARNVSHYFKFPQEQALHQFNLDAQGGQLVGIMGGSGSGKSTMLGILNGTIKPTFGKVTLEGHNLHDNPQGVAGWIGHVPQDDVLIAELTVRENLSFNAQLSLGILPAEEQEARVDEVLKKLGLWESQNLRVGSVLDKVISGGQRKRLNIGLELLRRPPVLFLDEPTSGLSSRDSEQILDILKELTYDGQLVFAVLHQPSSDLFKMLDRLFMLDSGGHPIYWGNPLDAVQHFNALASRVHADHCECSTCGNVNPEQIFDIVEAKTVDEYGRKTETRRTGPKEWNDFYTVMIGNTTREVHEPTNDLDRRSTLANAWQQWRTYFKRDVLTKWRNKQYLLVNALEAPALAMLLAGFMRYVAPGADYTFRHSENIPPFLFISVIVALFLGLSVSAEEILRDKSLLKRERFLQAKWHHYVHAKIAVVASVSLLHAVGFVGVSHLILELPDFLLAHVAVLFAVSFFGNVLGLVISTWFQSAKVIYIIIPLLVIPQIIFGGAIIRFERFNPVFTEADAVPWFGNVMASRWGFEALAVDLARNNPYDQELATWDDRIYQASWRRDFWRSEVKRAENQKWVDLELERAAEELSLWSGTDFEWSWKEGGEIQWEEVKAMYNNHYASAFRSRQQLLQEASAAQDLVALKNACHNDELWDWVLQNDRQERAIRLDNILIQKSGPIHRVNDGTNGWDATMYMPYKSLGRATLPTLYFNLLVLATMAVAMWILLLVSPSVSRRWSSRQV